MINVTKVMAGPEDANLKTLFPLFECLASKKTRDCVLVMGKHHTFWYHTHLCCLYKKTTPCPSRWRDSQMETRTIRGPLDICYRFKQGNQDYIQYNVSSYFTKPLVNDIFARAEGNTNNFLRNVNRSHFLK